jgi:hypothetical protein
MAKPISNGVSIQETLKKNITLIIGLSIPVLMVFFVTASVYIPRLWAPTEVPGFDFVYTIGDQFGADYYYRVADGKITKEKVEYPQDSKPPMRAGEMQLFLYNVTDTTSREISFEDAQKLTLKSGAVSPDGFEVVSRNGGGFPFSAPYDYNAKYLKKGSYYTKLGLSLGENDWYRFQFLAWVVDNK